MAKQDEQPGTLDLIIEELGQCGKYNIINYLTIIVPILFTGMFGSAYVFVAGDIDYRCRISDCESLNHTEWTSWAAPSGTPRLEKCSHYGTPFAGNNSSNWPGEEICTRDWFDARKVVKCEEFVYGKDTTIVKDFNLGCQEWKRTLVGSIHNAGFFVSLSLTGMFSDRFGRKTALAIASILTGFMGLIRSFSANYEMFLVFEFLETALGGGLYTSAFILMMELVSPKNRVLMNALMSIVFSTGLVTLASLSWMIQDWKIVLRIAYIPAIFFVMYLWILDESVRWLLARGRHHDAIEIIKKAAKSNKVTLSDDLISRLCATTTAVSPEEPREMKMLTVDASDPVEVAVEVREDSKLRQIMASPILLKRLFSCAFLWITCTFIYYGLSINAVSLSGNKYLNYIYVCLVEIPSHFSSIFIVDRFGRRRTLITTFAIAGLSCVSLAFIPEGRSFLSLVLYLSGKFAITMSYSVVYLYISEVFPTSLRQSLLGFTSTLGRIGSLVAPQVPLMAYYMKSLPSLLFGFMALTSAALSFTMPETTNRKLPDTIQEAETLTRKST